MMLEGRVDDFYDFGSVLAHACPNPAPGFKESMTLHWEAMLGTCLKGRWAVFRQPCAQSYTTKGEPKRKMLWLYTSSSSVEAWGCGTET